MSIFYPSSNSVHIFPISNTRTKHTNEGVQIFSNGRSLTEENLSKIFAAMSDKDKYIINHDIVTGKFILMLEGYFVEIIQSPVDKKPLFVSLVRDSNKINSLDEEINSTQTFQFKGIQLSDEYETDYQWLQLFDTEGKVPEKSYIRFLSKSIDSIDGGVI